MKCHFTVSPRLRIRPGKLRNEPTEDGEYSVIETGTGAVSLSSRHPEDFIK